MALAMEWPPAADGLAVGFGVRGIGRRALFFASVHFWVSSELELGIPYAYRKATYSTRSYFSSSSNSFSPRRGVGRRLLFFFMSSTACFTAQWPVQIHAAIACKSRHMSPTH